MSRRRIGAILALLLSLVGLLLLIGGTYLGSDCSTKLEFLPASLPGQGDRNIFFVETSCAVKNKASSKYSFSSGLVLHPRAACAVESAAVAHPLRPVYLVHSCPLDEDDPLRGALPYARALFALPNVFLWNAPFDRLFKNSPLQGLMGSGVLHQSKWPESHGSDILRYFLLWKYGGTYLDTDVLVLRPFDELRDFTCPEHPSVVSSGAMDFSWEAPGRLMAQKCLEETLRFNPKQWGANGPGVITRSMKSVCETKKVRDMTPEKCKGFQLLPTPAFYPVYGTWRNIFDEKKAASIMKVINGSYAIHMWNAMSRGLRLNTSSNQAYVQIARRVCPGVMAHVGEVM